MRDEDGVIVLSMLELQTAAVEYLHRRGLVEPGAPYRQSARTKPAA